MRLFWLSQFDGHFWGGSDDLTVFVVVSPGSSQMPYADILDFDQEGAADGVGGIGPARMDGARVGEAAQDRRHESEVGRALETRDGDDVGLDCRAVAQGLPAQAGQWFERTMTDNSTIAGTDTFSGLTPFWQYP